MKKVYILAGTGSNSEDFWFPYIRKSLHRDEFQVFVPNLPNNENPVLAPCLDALKNSIFDEDTILIGHSSGCPLILSILERLNGCIGRAILVAGYSFPLSDEESPILQPSYNWELIRKKSKEFIYIHSLNDPWGCGKEQGEIFLEKLGGTLILRENEGHMGSKKFHQPYTEFPLLKSLIELPLSLR